MRTYGVANRALIDVDTAAQLIFLLVGGCKTVVDHKQTTYTPDMA